MIRPDSIRNLFGPPRQAIPASTMGLRGAELSKMVKPAAETATNTSTLVQNAEKVGNLLGQTMRATISTSRTINLVLGNMNRSVATLKAIQKADAEYREGQLERENKLIRITREGFEGLLKQAKRSGSGVSLADAAIAAIALKFLRPLGLLAVVGRAIAAPFRALLLGATAAAAGLRGVASVVRGGILRPLVALRGALSAAAVAAASATNPIMAIGRGLRSLGSSVAVLGRGASAAFIAPVGRAITGIFGSNGIFAVGARIVGSVGRSLGIGAAWAGVSRLLAPIGGLLRTIAWPITAILGVIDAVRGWNDAGREFNTGEREATTLQKMSSAVGRVLDSFTFGLTTWISTQFGFDRTSHLLEAAGTRISEGFNALYARLPTKEQVTQFLTGGAGVFTLQGILGLATAPLRAGIQAVEWISTQIPTLAQITTFLTGEASANGFTLQGILSLAARPFALIGQGVQSMWRSLPDWAAVEAAITALPGGATAAEIIRVATAPARLLADAFAWVRDRIPEFREVIANIPSLSDIWQGMGNRISSMVSDMGSWIEDGIRDVGYTIRRQLLSSSTVDQNRQRTEQLASGAADVGGMAQQIMGNERLTPRQLEERMRDTIGLSGASRETRQAALAALRQWQNNGGATQIEHAGAVDRRGQTRANVQGVENRLGTATALTSNLEERRNTVQADMAQRAERRQQLERELAELQRNTPAFGQQNRAALEAHRSAINTRRTEIGALSRDDAAAMPELERTRRGIEINARIIQQYTEQLDAAKEADSRAVAEVNRLAEALERLREAVPAPMPPGAVVPGARDAETGQILPNARGNVIYQGRVIPYALGGVLTNGGHIQTTPRAFGMAGGNTGVVAEAGAEAILPVTRMAGGGMGVDATISAAGIESRLDAAVAAIARSERALSEEMSKTEKAVKDSGERIAALLTPGETTGTAFVSPAQTMTMPSALPSRVTASPSPMSSSSVASPVTVSSSPNASGTAPLAVAGRPAAALVPGTTATTPSGVAGAPSGSASVVTPVSPLLPGAAPSSGAAGQSTAAARPAAGGGAVAPIPINTGSGPKIVELLEAGPGWNKVKYDNGRIEKRTGDRNWRNNNPGNLEYNGFTRSKGAVAGDGRFAIFPTYEHGKSVKTAMLFEGSGYRNLPITQAIARYAPPSENNTANYARQVLQAAGGQDIPMGQLNAQQRAAVVQVMERIEGGTRPGRVEEVAAGDGRMPSTGGGAPAGGGGGEAAAAGAGAAAASAARGQRTAGMTTTGILGGLMGGTLSMGDLSQADVLSVASTRNYFGGDTTPRGENGRRTETPASLMAAARSRGITPNSRPGVIPQGASPVREGTADAGSPGIFDLMQRRASSFFGGGETPARAVSGITPAQAGVTPDWNSPTGWRNAAGEPVERNGRRPGETATGGLIPGTVTRDPLAPALPTGATRMPPIAGPNSAAAENEAILAAQRAAAAAPGAVQVSSTPSANTITRMGGTAIAPSPGAGTALLPGTTQRITGSTPLTPVAPHRERPEDLAILRGQTNNSEFVGGRGRSPASGNGSSLTGEGRGGLSITGEGGPSQLRVIRNSERWRLDPSDPNYLPPGTRGQSAPTSPTDAAMGRRPPEAETGSRGTRTSAAPVVEPMGRRNAAASVNTVPVESMPRQQAAVAPAAAAAGPPASTPAPQSVIAMQGRPSVRDIPMLDDMTVMFNSFMMG